MCGSFFYCQLTVDLAAAGDEWLPMGRPGIAAVWRRRGRAHGRGQEGKDNQGFLSPLDSPNFPLSRSAEHSRLNGGYGGSVPCVGQLLGRITALNLLCVNRSAVSARPDSAGRSFALRKALLRSRMYPWSTKRICGPLAFRRATEGSRVQRKVRGVKRGQETIWCPVPFCPCRWAPTPPAAEGGHCPRSLRA